jgi:predicted DNA-binding transcriptional regulator AlpA
MDLVASKLPAVSGRRSDSPPLTPKARRLWPDFCRAAGISRSHAYKLESQGKLKIVRIGRRAVVPETELDRLMSEGVA